MRAVCLVLLAWLSVPSISFAQDLDDDLGAESYWIDVFYPKLLYTARDGFGFGAHAALQQPLRFDAWDKPYPYHASLAFDVLATTNGSHGAALVFSAPGLSDGWRFAAEASAWRWARDPYHGLGNASRFDKANRIGAPRFYRAQHDRFRLRGEAQRRLVGPLRFLAGFGIDRARLAPLAGPSVLASDIRAGQDPTLGSFATDAGVRVGLVVDTRNDEAAPERGLLAEAIFGAADASVAGDMSYTRTTVSIRGYVPVTPRFQLAGRLLGQGMTGTPRTTALYLIEESDRTATGLGGARSLRIVRDNRYLGRNKLLGNLEARVLLFGLPQVYRLTAVAFVDGGRVFEPDAFRVTFNGWHVGGGGGLFLQIGRSAIIGGTAGVGPDGVALNFHTLWPF